MPDEKKEQRPANSILTEEQDALLDLYLHRLDEHFEYLKKAEKAEVEIETLHLKRILSKS